MNSTVDLKLATEILASQAIVLIRSRYEDVPFERRLFYHDTFHTHGVRERVFKIARAMGLSDRHLMLTDIAAAFHDSVQAWRPVKKGNGVIIRQRHAGTNEVASTQEAVDAMSNSDIEFTPEEYGIVASAVIATIPSWSVEHGTVVQPFLTACSHPVARAVALADLGAAGMDTACFVRDWKTLFAEEQLDIMAILPKIARASDIGAAIQEEYRARYVAWLKSQAPFARGRRALLNHELEGIADTDARQHVRALFSHFGESIAAAKEAHTQAQTIGFVPLMRQVLPSAFPGEGR